MYFSIITQALTFAAMLLFFRNETGFGGNNGFTDFKRILGVPIATSGMRVTLCVISGVVLIAFFVMARAIVTSRYGRVLQAIRDAESRVMFTGYDPVAYKLAIWTLSAVMCAIAGALYVPQVGIINPSEMTPGRIDRDRDLGRRGRARDADRADRRRLLRQRREELVHGGLPRVLAVLPRRAVHRGDAVPAPGPGGAAAPQAGPGMTPELMAEGAARLAAYQARQAAAGSSGDRAAGFGRPLRVGEPDFGNGVALYVEDVSVSFDGFKALNALNLTIDVGELRCIIGPNGAGKTTMMDVITGKTAPDEGRVFFGSTIDLLQLREPQIAQIGVGRKFQKPTVYEQLSVLREPGARAEGRPACARGPVRAAERRPAATASTRC